MLASFALPSLGVVYIACLQVLKRLERRHIAHVCRVVDEYIQTTLSQNLTGLFRGESQTLLVCDIRRNELCRGDSVGRKSGFCRLSIPHQPDYCVRRVAGENLEEGVLLDLVSFVIWTGTSLLGELTPRPLLAPVTR